MTYKEMILKGINFKVNQWNYKYIDKAINDILLDIENGYSSDDVITDRIDKAIMSFEMYCVTNELER